MPLSPRMPDLPAFEMLLAIAKTGSLGAAGRELGLTQQAVSARLSAMEAQTGVRLVTRSARGSQLTSAGAVVTEWADQLLEVAAHVDAGLASLRTASRKKVTVAASLTVAEHLMPRWIVSLQASAARAGQPAPEVILSAGNSEQAVANVRAGSADLGFIESPGALAGIRSRVVAQDSLVVVVPPDHKWVRRSKPVSAAELSQTPLAVREQGSGTRDTLTAALRAVLGPGVQQAAPALELSSSVAVRGAVLAGAGPAVMSRLAVADDLAIGRLRCVDVPEVDLRRTLRAIWTGGRNPPAGAVRELLSHIGSTATGRGG
ncbi:LysR family transcriptional regulator [Mycolicibacter hiberniae]|uniref:LysR family transcriptional regulator n=1 Tax=Mycolicibacter hiberniae TaxID=29314 RepID=A0A7I7WZ66_9MYCO|nr:LysR family transcriptional regulator [Mycolicibacter hiberniae]MCV7085418.1 LysR family transcriptional regulator [Mycolicibacter hiberniae]ORV71216.1 LysR family transcriptional regulator [Mycolicibacter hiberniae]BBZ22422.1 LysR family transcriptional regulator [Mycolicibacter hiberniae]